MARLFLERWPEMVKGLIEGTVRAAKALKRRHLPLYLLSNCSVETFPLVRQRYDFPALFDGMVISGEIGLLNPAPELSRPLMAPFHLRAAECLFIDDVAANIEAAAKLGFQTHLFRSAAELAETLVALGCLTAAELAADA